MIKNETEYWRFLERLGESERPSPRVCQLLLGTFERWRRKPSWLSASDIGSIFDGKSGEERETLARLSVAERKGLALRKLAGILTHATISRRAETVRIMPDDLIVGTIPPYSVGMGKKMVSYLTQAEELEAAVNYLDEHSPFGHVVPDHSVELVRGLGSVIDDLSRRAAEDPDHGPFYRSVGSALAAILDLAEGWSDLVRNEAERFSGSQRTTLLDAATRLKRVPKNPPESFIDAVQSVFFVHMALHAMGETVPLGRLDQLLWPFLEADLNHQAIRIVDAQEIVDCFVIKLDERVTLDHNHIEDHFAFADGALLGIKGGSNFDQGGLVNQWMQQLTLGGIEANDDPKQVIDASNDLTLMFLEAARRLPVNSPTFDLRLHKHSRNDVIQAAARSLLSGGAHPVLLNDDKIIPALHKDTGGQVALKSARNYACDGCYETLFAGETEFSFGVIGAMDAIEKALNQGANFIGAGPIHLRGRKDSFRTIPAGEIADFDEFWSIMERHLRLSVLRYVSGFLTCYGEKERVAPSPLLSAFIAGCIESGRDFSGGGARYHMISPLLTGISTAADSLWVLKHLVFEGEIGIDELVTCLRRNWDAGNWSPGVNVSSGRVQAIRRIVCAEPKFGHGNRNVDELAWRLVDSFCDAVDQARCHPIFDSIWLDLKNRYDLPGRPFEILFAPGVGTFEQYIFGGQFVGASPDGRKAGTPIASDLSASPIPDDERVTDDQGEHLRKIPVFPALSSYNSPAFERLSDGAPPDLTLPEDCSERQLVDIIKAFVDGRAGNVMTVTVADPTTLARAATDPSKYEFVRVRMGGWTEFFVTLFPKHQAQHQRRPLYVFEDMP